MYSVPENEKTNETTHNENQVLQMNSNISNDNNQVLQMNSSDSKTSQDMGLKSTSSFTKKRRASLTKRARENNCTTVIFDFWDLISYIIIRVAPISGRCPFFRSCRTGHTPMAKRIEAAHTGLSVSYDDYTGMINTILFVAALFLSFVSATITVVSADDFLKADLAHCRRGWAQKETCIDIDSAGYFGSYNATGLLIKSSSSTADAARLSSATTLLHGQGWMEPISLNQLSYSTWWDV